MFYTTFSQINEFDNKYLDFFSKDAFTNQIHHITNNYLAESRHIVSDFPDIYKLDLDLFTYDIINFLHGVYKTL